MKKTIFSILAFIFSFNSQVFGEIEYHFSQNLSSELAGPISGNLVSEFPTSKTNLNIGNQKLNINLSYVVNNDYTEIDWVIGKRIYQNEKFSFFGKILYFDLDPEIEGNILAVRGIGIYSLNKGIDLNLTLEHAWSDLSIGNGWRYRLGAKAEFEKYFLIFSPYICGHKHWKDGSNFFSACGINIVLNNFYDSKKINLEEIFQKSFTDVGPIENLSILKLNFLL